MHEVIVGEFDREIAKEEGPTTAAVVPAIMAPRPTTAWPFSADDDEAAMKA